MAPRDTVRSALLEYERSRDPYGLPLPFTGPRFRLLVREHNPAEEPGWKYQLSLIDHGYADSDGLPVISHPHGDSWEEAYACAAEFITQALQAVGRCIF